MLTKINLLLSIVDNNNFTLFSGYCESNFSCHWLKGLILILPKFEVNKFILACQWLKQKKNCSKQQLTKINSFPPMAAISIQEPFYSYQFIGDDTNLFLTPGDTGINLFSPNDWNKVTSASRQRDLFFPCLQLMGINLLLSITAENKLF